MTHPSPLLILQYPTPVQISHQIKIIKLTTLNYKQTILQLTHYIYLF